MIVLEPDYREFLELLNAQGVNYIIVGGYAVGFHGRPRYTGDIDVWIAVSAENSSKMMKALQQFGFGGLGVSQADFMKDDLILQLGYEPVRIDVITSVTGLRSFQECEARAKVIDLEGLRVPFLSLDDLITNKKATGRAIDKADVKTLTKLKGKA